MAFSFLHFLCSQIQFVFNGMIAGHFDFMSHFLCTFVYRDNLLHVPELQ